MGFDYASIGRAIAMVVSPWGQSQALGWFSARLIVTPRNHVQPNLKGFPRSECKFDRCFVIPRPLRIFCVNFGGMREQKMRSAATDSKLDRFKKKSISPPKLAVMAPILAWVFTMEREPPNLHEPSVWGSLLSLAPLDIGCGSQLWEHGPKALATAKIANMVEGDS